jgi:hypothetical protein
MLWPPLHAPRPIVHVPHHLGQGAGHATPGQPRGCRHGRAHLAQGQHVQALPQRAHGDHRAATWMTLRAADAAVRDGEDACAVDCQPRARTLI